MNLLYFRIRDRNHVTITHGEGTQITDAQKSTHLLPAADPLRVIEIADERRTRPIRGQLVIRYTLLVLAMLAIAVVAQKNWFRALCYMLPMLAFLERPDMPRQMLGIGGLNPFNILLGIILLAWLAQRTTDGSRWEGDKTVKRLLIAYLIVILVSTLRAIIDYDTFAYYMTISRSEAPTTARFIIDSVFQSGKWIIPGMLICVGANTQERVRLAIFAVLWTGAALSLQIISKMMPALVGIDDLATRALRVLDRDLGYHRVDLAAITASIAWVFVAAKPMFDKRFATAISLGGFILCTTAMAATGGRAGMMAWTVAALMFGFFRWKKVLILVPAFALMAVLFIPGLQDRLIAGFTTDSEQSARRTAWAESVGAIDEQGRDRYAMTSGRALVWPVVIETANESPIVGHGREAMYRTGIVERLATELRITSFGHPHNAYLELYLDMGLIGVLIIGAFYWLVIRRSVGALKRSPGSIEAVIGSVVLAFLFVNLTAALGSQSFYPKQGATLLWVAMGLAIKWLIRAPQTATAENRHIDAQPTAEGPR